MMLQFRSIQNSFTLIVKPVSVASAEADGLGGSDTIQDDSRATAGESQSVP